MVGVFVYGAEAHCLQQLEELRHSVTLQHAHRRHIEGALYDLVCRNGSVEASGEVVRREVIVIVRRILDERSGQYEPLLEHGRVEQGLEGAAARAGSGNHVHFGSAKAAGKTVCIAIICLHLSAVHVQNQYSHIVHQVLVVDFEMVAGYVVDPFLQSFVNGAGVGFVTALGAQPF